MAALPLGVFLGELEMYDWAGNWPNGIAVLLWLVVGPGIYLLWSNWPPRPDGEELMAAMNTLAEAGWFDYKREQAEQEQKSNEE
jgi:hypothetical protein